MTDEELLATSERDRAAFGEFYERTERAVLGYFGAATRSADLAADLTAETFAAALSSVGRFDRRRGSARLWLFGIARHVLAHSAQRGRWTPRRGVCGGADGPTGCEVVALGDLAARRGRDNDLNYESR